MTKRLEFFDITGSTNDFFAFEYQWKLYILILESGEKN